MARVAALIPDLLFGSKVQAALQAAGHEVDLLTGEVRGVGRGGRHRPARRRPHARPTSTASSCSRPSPPAASYTACVASASSPTCEPEVRERALAAGFDQVVPRSRMAREGAQLVDALLADARWLTAGAPGNLGRAPPAAPAAHVPAAHHHLPPRRRARARRGTQSSGARRRRAGARGALARARSRAVGSARRARRRLPGRRHPARRRHAHPRHASSPGAPRPSCWARATSCAPGTTTSPFDALPVRGQLARAHPDAHGDPRHARRHRRRPLAVDRDGAARPPRPPRAQPRLSARDRPAAARRRSHARAAVGAGRALGTGEPRRRARAGRAAPPHAGHAGRRPAPVGHHRADGAGARGSHRAHDGGLAAARRPRRGARTAPAGRRRGAVAPSRAATRSRGRTRGRRPAGAW